MPVLYKQAPDAASVQAAASSKKVISPLSTVGKHSLTECVLKVVGPAGHSVLHIPCPSLLEFGPAYPLLVGLKGQPKENAISGVRIPKQRRAQKCFADFVGFDPGPWAKLETMLLWGFGSPMKSLPGLS